MGKFDGKVVFVTGAARGQGRSHAVRFAEEGANIVALDLCEQIDTVAYPMSTPEDLEQTVKAVEAAGGRIIARQADVRNRDQVKAVVDEGMREFGRIDVVLPNAGIMPCIEPQGDQVQAWHDTIDVMLTGVFTAIDLTIGQMVDRDEGGSIVITSSTAGLIGAALGLDGANTPGHIGYHAAKHGVVGLMRLYSNMLAPYNIRVNAVHPTGVNTPMVVNEEFDVWIQKHPTIASCMQNTLPVELVQADDISNAILFLCSEGGRYITGVSLPVDAGFTNRA